MTLEHSLVGDKAATTLLQTLSRWDEYNMSVPAFEHRALDTSVQQIRLIKLRKASDAEQDLFQVKLNGRQNEAPKATQLQPDVQCDVAHFILESAPPYRAVSYTWGPPEPTRSITINDEPFGIRENLFQFLEVIIQSEESDGYLWIDQLCIAQENVLERNHQVKHMGDIFQRAVQVIMWLGASDETSDRAMEIIRTKGSNCHGLPATSLHPGPSLLSEGEIVGKLLSRPYFSRLWIVQEVLLARQAKILCGRARLDWSQLKNFYYQ